MSKPEDVTQEAWDEAKKVLDTYLRTPVSADEAIARAIQAAKLEAYQEAAKVAEETVLEVPLGRGMADGASMASRQIVSAIQKLGQGE